MDAQTLTIVSGVVLLIVFALVGLNVRRRSARRRPKATTKLNALGLGYAAAVVSAVIMLLLGILGNLGIYTGAVEMMQQWHMFFSLSIGGIIAGMIEAAVISFVFAYIFGWLYNKFV